MGALFGRGGGNRTHATGFGDRCSTTELHPSNLALVARFWIWQFPLVVNGRRFATLAVLLQLKLISSVHHALHCDIANRLALRANEIELLSFTLVCHISPF